MDLNKSGLGDDVPADLDQIYRRCYPPFFKIQDIQAFVQTIAFRKHSFPRPQTSNPNHEQLSMN